ncbi:MAG: accessory factor UbiK family protein [Deltaproteobacteria bacterium]|nr:accessory factor UbiK family protein [Deltaproteobacteria bacterium]
MSDLLDKAILIGMGLEKKAKEVIEELQKEGKVQAAATGAEAGGEGLPPREAAENRVVEDGVKVLKEFLSLLKSGREKLEKEVSSGSGRLLDKINAATKDDVDIVKEMARVAREKVDKLEKRVAELEAKLGK